MQNFPQAGAGQDGHADCRRRMDRNNRPAVLWQLWVMLGIQSSLAINRWVKRSAVAGLSLAMSSQMPSRSAWVRVSRTSAQPAATPSCRHPRNLHLAPRARSRVRCERQGLPTILRTIPPSFSMKSFLPGELLDQLLHSARAYPGLLGCREPIIDRIKVFSVQCLEERFGLRT